jgi:hypothetical protein
MRILDLMYLDTAGSCPIEAAHGRLLAVGSGGLGFIGGTSFLVPRFETSCILVDVKLVDEGPNEAR